EPIWPERRDCTGDGKVGNSSENEPADRSADQPGDQLVARDLIVALLSRLRPRSRRIIRSYFLEEKTMVQVGQEVGISQSGVSLEINRLMGLLSEMATNHEPGAICHEKGTQLILKEVLPFFRHSLACASGSAGLRSRLPAYLPDRTGNSGEAKADEG